MLPSLMHNKAHVHDTMMMQVSCLMMRMQISCLAGWQCGMPLDLSSDNITSVYPTRSACKPSSVYSSTLQFFDELFVTEFIAYQ